MGTNFTPGMTSVEDESPPVEDIQACAGAGAGGDSKFLVNNGPEDGVQYPLNIVYCGGIYKLIIL